MIKMETIIAGQVVNIGMFESQQQGKTWAMEAYLEQTVEHRFLNATTNEEIPEEE